jgi:Phosphodiester glycosidase
MAGEKVRLSRTCIRLEDGASTTVHALMLPRGTFRPRIIVLPRPEPLLSWCRRTGHAHALTGGFFSRGSGLPLGRLWCGGVEVPSSPWGGKRWGDRRGAVHIDGDSISIGPLGEMPREPVGELLTAGPVLVHAGRSVIAGDCDFEGIPETWTEELDADWTRARAQRSAIGISARQLIAVACEGLPVDAAPASGDAGLTIAELAEVLVELGAEAALNLDGGGGTSLVCEGKLVNRPRAGSVEPGYEHGELIAAGRPLHTAIAFPPCSS